MLQLDRLLVLALHLRDLCSVLRTLQLLIANRAKPALVAKTEVNPFDEDSVLTSLLDLLH